MTVDSAAFAVEFDDTLTLESDEEETIPVSFLPTERRDYTGTLTIQTERRDVVVELSGTGIFQSAPDLILHPSAFSLSTPYPNPFNSTLHIEYSLPLAGQVSLKLYDISGREVAFIEGSYRTAGEYSTVWEVGRLPSGVYLLLLDAGNSTAMAKVVLVK